jgi:hypothetical protein
MDASMSDSDSFVSKDCDEGTQLVGPVDTKSEFEDTELEEVVLLEGSQQILQLTLEEQADHFMKEETIDNDDYAD